LRDVLDDLGQDHVFARVIEIEDDRRQRNAIRDEVRANELGVAAPLRGALSY